MCQSRATGGKRCATHSRTGQAALLHAQAITELDSAQATSVFRATRASHADAPTPTASEAVASLTRLRREAASDPRIDPALRDKIVGGYDRAIAAADNGDIPDGTVLAAAQAFPAEAEIAQRNLDNLVVTSARHQRKNPERLAATFRKWRRDDRFEEMEAPDPTFRPDTTGVPADRDTLRALRKLGWENYLAQRLPVFTYGTLRANQSNAHLADGGLDHRIENAHAPGIAIYGANRGFPYAQESSDSTAVTQGDLVHLTDDPSGDWSRSRLDTLEGFDSDHYSRSHYRRVTHDITHTDPTTGQEATTKAWVYLAGTDIRPDLHEHDRIYDGDWVKAKDEYRARRNANRGNPGYVVRKHATDPNPPSVHSTTRSAAEVASVFAAAGLIDDDEADEHAAFWATQNR